MKNTRNCPKKGEVSNLIIQWSHNSVTCGARGLILRYLRNNAIWIISANADVQEVIHRCVTCHKLQGKTSFQKMANVPVERCTEVLPFTYCGVNMFGPYPIKERSSQLKRYGALFTCFTCRIIHIKVANALDANFFILAPRKLMAKRSAVRSIWSDIATRFLGTRNELQQGFKEMSHNKIKNFLKKNRADWIYWHHNHQQHHIWVGFGSVSSEQLETY